MIMEAAWDTIRLEEASPAFLVAMCSKKNVKEVRMNMKANPAIWFEIPVVDLDRAQRFYETVLDLSLTPSGTEPFTMAFFPMMEMDAPGASGSLVRADGYIPSTVGTLIYFSVQDIDDVLRKVNAAGGKTLLPKMSIGEYGFIGHFQDTEGNKIGLHVPPAN